MSFKKDIIKMVKKFLSSCLLILLVGSLGQGVSWANQYPDSINSTSYPTNLSFRSQAIGHPNFSSITLPPPHIPGRTVLDKNVEETIVSPVVQAPLLVVPFEDDTPPEEEPEESLYFHGFKGNCQHTGYIDVETSNEISMLWRYSFYGDYITSIQVFNDNLYFADHSGYIHCISSTDATVQWKYPLERERYVVGIDISEKYMYVTYGPIFSRRGVEDDAALLYAVHLDTGEEAWHKRIEQSLMVSPPLADGDKVYVSTGKMTPTFSKTDGGKILEFTEEGNVTLSLEIEEFSFYGSHLTKQGSIIMGPAYKFDRATRTIVPPQLYAFDLEKDRQLWMVKPIGESGFLGVPSIRGDYIYMTENPFRMGRGPRPANESWLQKIELSTGKMVQSMRFKDENFGSFAPTLAKDALYICSFTGRLYCVNYDLEHIWWEKRLDRFSYFTELMASKNYLYTILYEGEFLCISKSDGSIHYRYATGNYGRMPVVTGEDVYVSGNALYCFSEHAEPILFVEPSTMMFGNIKEGETAQKKFQVVWTGTDNLEGEAIAVDSWITIVPTNITQNIQSCYLTLDTKGLPEGTNKTQVLIETNKGTKTIDIEVYVVVPKPVTITVNIPEDGILTNDSQFTIEGETEPFAQVCINGYTVVAYPNGYFYDRIKLIEGENPVEIDVLAKDGRTASFSGVIIKDSIPPTLEVNLPRYYETTSREIEITGKTEPGVELKIGRKRVDVEKDGTFSYTLTIDRDEEEVRIRAIDEAENTTQVKIQVVYIGD